MSRTKITGEEISNSLPTARELALELEYDEGDPREAMREAFKYEPSIDDIFNVDKTYNDFLLIREGAPKGKILGPTVEIQASHEGRLRQMELGTLKTAYQLNEMEQLTCDQAREVVEAEKALAAKYNVKTPLTTFAEMVDKSSKSLGL